MRPVMNRAFLMKITLAVLLPSATAFAVEPTYDLMKLPIHKAGDIFTDTNTCTSLLTIKGGDGRLLKDRKSTVRAVTRTEVLGIDADGTPKAVQVTIISRDEDLSSTTPFPYTKSVALRQVAFTRKLQGQWLLADTTSLVSTVMKSLSAYQVHLVKAILGDRASIEPGGLDRLLLDPRRVTVGQTWDLPRSILQRWSELGAQQGQPVLEPVSGQFTLVGVRDGVASVDGVVVFASETDGHRTILTTQVTADIEVATGRWVKEVTQTTLTTTGAGVEVSRQTRSESAFTYTSGISKAAGGAAREYDLGWAPPGKDVNNFRNQAEGISLWVPNGYKQDPAPPEKLLARFTDGSATVQVMAADIGEPLELGDVRKSLPDQYATAGLTVKEIKDVVLAGNVPAFLVTCVSRDGSGVVYTTIAMDGERMLTLSTGGQADNEKQLQQCLKIALSLRVFTPKTR